MISIIVVNYNASNFLYENLKSISKSNLSKIEYEIIVIDNNSTIKLDENELNQYNVKLLHLKKNVGYASALNYGIKKSVGKYLLTINPDILFKEDSIERLYNYYQSNKIGVIGCKVLNFNGTYQLSSRRRFPSFKYLFCKLFKINKYYNYIDYDIDMIHEVDSISGCCMLFTKDIYDKVGGFDEKFFLYFEDTDFCLRIKELGSSIIYYPKSEIVHFKYGSRNFYNYFYVKYQFYKSFIIFIIKYSNKYRIRAN